MTGKQGPPDSDIERTEAFRNALKTSEVVIYVDHGFFPQGSTGSNVAPLGIQVGFELYGTDGTARFGGALPGAKPEGAAPVFGNFSCNSSLQSNYFTFSGNGFQVTVDGGVDGGSGIGTLEKAANAFVKAYAQTKGSIAQKAEAGRVAAQNVFDRSRVEMDRGDKIILKPR